MSIGRRGKPCPDCGKPIDHDLSTVGYCRECWKARRRAAQARYRKNNPEKVKADTARWLKEHPEVNRRNVAASRARKRGSVSEKNGGGSSEN